MISAFKNLYVFIGIRGHRMLQEFKEGKIPFRWKDFPEMLKPGLGLEG